MSDDFNPEKKGFFERPEFYLFAVIGAVVLGVVHYSETKEDYRPSTDKLQIMDAVKREHKGFLNKLTENECYAINVVQKFENAMGQISTAPLNNTTRYRVKPINYVVKDGKYLRLQNYAIHSNYNVPYFSSDVEYKCVKGGRDYSTPYYFRSRDFKELSEYNQIETAKKLSGATENKTVRQSMFNACYKGKTVLFNKNCESKGNGFKFINS